ncbi:MAG: CtkA family protein, partial [Clostridia bacterium]|nr:CtkA family protein [Clostridia bacterium]
MKEITIRNLDNYELSNRNGMYGGNAGSKDGILIDGEYWIVKYPKSTKFLSGDKRELGSYSTAPLSEFIGSNIYAILGYDVHETILGYRNNKIVVACKDFCESENVFLREFRTIKNIYNKDVESMIEEHLSSTSSSNSLEIEELRIHLKYNPILSKIEGITERFWDCVVVDAFIANNDRNNGNWGLLVENNEYKLAPIFDNGAS